MNHSISDWKCGWIERREADLGELRGQGPGLGVQGALRFAWHGDWSSIYCPNIRQLFKYNIYIKMSTNLICRDGRSGWFIYQLAHKYGHLMFILFGFNYRASRVNLVTSSHHSMMWEDSQIYSGDPVMSNLPVKSPAFPVPGHDQRWHPRVI